jgi:hypothetical protein
VFVGVTGDEPGCGGEHHPDESIALVKFEATS